MSTVASSLPSMASPAAVILSVEDLESHEETLEILGDPRLLEAIKRSEEDVRKGASNA